MKYGNLLISAFLALFALVLAPAANAGPSTTGSQIRVSHAIAMNGEPKYGPDFAHFDYVNPDAPKAGLFRQAAIGTFDSLNPFIAKGNSADGVGVLFDTLMVGSNDEPFTQYGLVAEKIEYPADRSWVIFHINPKARFHDGTPIKASDVVFTFTMLTKQGSPLYARYYADVTEAKALDAQKVRFSFGGKPNRELPLILGQLMVLPEHYWKQRDFNRTTLTPPIGSGPYKIESLKQGQSITYIRDETYWGRNLPVNRGRFNFKRIHYDYYRDLTVAFAAFKSGEYDFRLENISKQWATGYQGPPFEKGLLKKETIKHGLPAGMQCFAMNQRRSLFADRSVRYALAHAFDFEWTNNSIFYGAYRRTDSFFENSEMQAEGLPGPAELALLEPLRDHLWPEVFTMEYAPPSTAAKKGLRRNLRKALGLLLDTGWVIKDGVLRHKETDQAFTFEILLVQPSFERIVLPFAANLKKIGIEAKVRVVDTSQYINRLRDFDFDMIVASFGQSLSPGNEQRWFWHSEAAKVPGTRNYCGIENKAIDQLVELVINAESRSDLVNRCKALDRALLWGLYVIPHWYLDEFRVSYTAKVKHPQHLPPYNLDLFSWWIEE
jgi:microcin C transport system substrate-binding protein